MAIATDYAVAHFSIPRHLNRSPREHAGERTTSLDPVTPEGPVPPTGKGRTVQKCFRSIH